MARTYEEMYGEEKAKEMKRKQREAKLKKPTNYWLGKRRIIPKDIREKMLERQKETQKTGEEHHSWNGGSWDWWHNEARKVMGKHLGKELLSTEIVHHIDGNWKNNDLSNLVITNRSVHATIHHKGIPKSRSVKK